jgi:hypothetical protein
MSTEQDPEELAKLAISQARKKRIIQAKDGDPNSIKEIIEAFCQAVGRNTDKKGEMLIGEFDSFIDWPYMVFISECLRRVTEEMEENRKNEITRPPDMTRAFGFTNTKPGAKRKFGTDERDKGIWVRVTDKLCEIREEREKARKKNNKTTFVYQPLEEAISEIAEELKNEGYFDIGRPTVRSAYMRINKIWFPDK